MRRIDTLINIKYILDIFNTILREKKRERFFIDFIILSIYKKERERILTEKLPCWVIIFLLISDDLCVFIMI